MGCMAFNFYLMMRHFPLILFAYENQKSNELHIQVPTIVAKYLKANILYRPAIKSNQRDKHYDRPKKYRN